MKVFISFFLIAFTSANIFANQIEVESIVKNVTLYHSGALVKRVSNNRLEPGLNELLFKNISSKIVLSSLKISNKEITILNKSIIRKLTKEEFNQLLDRKEALKKQMNLIESKYEEVGFISKIEDLEKMTTFYSKKIIQTKKELRDIERKIESAKKLESIELKNENAAILRLRVSVNGNLAQPFKIQYVCGGIGWSPAYDITVESSEDKKIEIKYLAKTMSQTGEDWDNVTIRLSSSFPLESPTDLPKPNYPWVLKGRSFSYNTKLQGVSSQEDKEIQKLEGVEYENVTISSILKTRELKGKYSIKSNSTVFTFPIQTFKLPTSFNYYSFPAMDDDVYLVANISGWDTLGFIDGIANISFKGNEVGKSVVKFSESKDTLILPVGKDNSIFLNHSEIADKKYFKINNSGKKRKTTLAYQFELKNNNSFPVSFELIDQIPISQTKLAKVTVENTSNGTINKETGEINWILELNPGETTTKKLLFTIEMDSSYSYRKKRRRKSKARAGLPKFR